MKFIRVFLEMAGRNCSRVLAYMGRFMSMTIR